MSSSYPEYGTADRVRGGTLCFAILALGVSFAARSQDYYFQPQARVSTNLNSNAGLATSGPTTVSEGYSALAGGFFNLFSPENTVVLRPQVGYEDNPKITERTVLGNVDLYSQHRFERGEFDLSGQFNYSDTYNSELATATFNPVNPIQPTTPETGRFNFDANRTLETVQPTYKLNLTQRLSWTVTGTYQSVTFGGTDSSSYVPFNYYLGGTSLGWEVNQRMEVSIGGYGSREAAKDGSGSVNGGGGTVSIGYKWTPQFSGTLTLLAEHDDSSNVKPVVFKESTTSGGGTYTTSWKGEVSSLLLSVGRTFTPSGAGGKYAADQAQIQYERDFSKRLSMELAAHYIGYIALSTVYRGSDYHYVNSNASLKWKLTPTWYITGGTQFTWDKYANPVASANNELLYIAFGYEGLSRYQ